MSPRSNIQRKALFALIFAVCSPLTVFAQSTTTISSISSISSTIPTSAPASSIIPTTTSGKTEPSVVTAAPTPSVTESTEYYPSIPGQSYDNVPQDGPAPDDGSQGQSDTFVSVPLAGQIGIIVAVVFVSVLGLVATIMFYLRRRRLWELEVQRRSTIPRITVDKSGAFKMAAPPARPVSPAESFDPLDIEKGNVKSEFEAEPKRSWKNFLSRD